MVQASGPSPPAVNWAARELIEACPALEIISVYGVGHDAVNLGAARARGIRVTNTRMS